VGIWLAFPILLHLLSRRLSFFLLVGFVSRSAFKEPRQKKELDREFRELWRADLHVCCDCRVIDV